MELNYVAILNPFKENLVSHCSEFYRKLAAWLESDEAYMVMVGWESSSSPIIMETCQPRAQASDVVRKHVEDFFLHLVAYSCQSLKLQMSVSIF